MVAPVAMAQSPTHLPALRMPMMLDGHLLVETADGARRTLSAPAEARSGDRLIFMIRYRNAGTRPLPGYDIVAPVPAGVQILPDRQDSLRVSADGGKNWTRPGAPFPFDKSGHLRRAEHATITHIRLRLSQTIAPGESGAVAYRGKLL